ncbi:hypothetical protein HFN78_14210 [Rhizobium laguerreae]|uniref:hypothetical protein n=1 Tax=Rhizobium laguerreae TaxID=1076926 RepID=UPI001C923A58|nr:hypothetical protein [Rhizobium laguerreae]MBY3472072.1 hypothetical protein [Rhizobium laguerreae]
MAADAFDVSRYLGLGGLKLGTKSGLAGPLLRRREGAEGAHVGYAVRTVASDPIAVANSLPIN